MRQETMRRHLTVAARYVPSGVASEITKALAGQELPDNVREFLSLLEEQVSHPDVFPYRVPDLLFDMARVLPLSTQQGLKKHLPSDPPYFTYTKAFLEALDYGIDKALHGGQNLSYLFDKQGEVKYICWRILSGPAVPLYETLDETLRTWSVSELRAYIEEYKHNTRFLGGVNLYSGKPDLDTVWARTPIGTVRYFLALAHIAEREAKASEHPWDQMQGRKKSHENRAWARAQMQRVTYYALHPEKMPPWERAWGRCCPRIHDSNNFAKQAESDFDQVWRDEFLHVTRCTLLA